MKVILFDLGNTLEDTQREILMPGAMRTLNAIQAMRDSDGHPPALALVSDFGTLLPNNETARIPYGCRQR